MNQKHRGMTVFLY